MNNVSYIHDTDKSYRKEYRALLFKTDFTTFLTNKESIYNVHKQ